MRKNSPKPILLEQCSTAKTNVSFPQNRASIIYTDHWAVSEDDSRTHVGSVVAVDLLHEVDAERLHCRIDLVDGRVSLQVRLEDGHCGLWREVRIGDAFRVVRLRNVHARTRLADDTEVDAFLAAHLLPRPHLLLSAVHGKTAAQLEQRRRGRETEHQPNSARHSSTSPAHSGKYLRRKTCVIRTQRVRYEVRAILQGAR